MANWFVVSIILIIVILLMAFVIPAFLTAPSAKPKQQTLDDFCAGFNMKARQRFFAGITQCYYSKTEGQTTTETACDVVRSGDTWEFKEECPVIVPVNITRR